MLGADPEELRALAREMSQRADQLREARATLSAKVNGPLQWHGPDAFFFKHAWNSSHAPTLHKAAEMLLEASRRLQQQAQDQQDTSSS
ncbi:hypothetical protein UM93_01460 [Psychromicrobium lacuslunae]|uniref:Uncharacterized protein n=2 Tax=Psychromicrobium lacuslunae TaxID=1618207 RepID=A0A0D4BW59_9MICC|nr:hypothetical protein UM93_01460 [Psychromicrobium lacuslunae]